MEGWFLMSPWCRWFSKAVENRVIPLGASRMSAEEAFHIAEGSVASFKVHTGKGCLGSPCTSSKRMVQPRTNSPVAAQGNGRWAGIVTVSFKEACLCCYRLSGWPGGEGCHRTPVLPSAVLQCLLRRARYQVGQRSASAVARRTD